MARQARVESESGIYHAIIRGVNRQLIFIDDNDRTFFLNRLLLHKKSCEIEIHAYCLMPNHVHLLVRDTNHNLSLFMKKLQVSYARYFNSRYDRVGHVYQDRFKSFPVETEAYYSAVFRYIHQNPEKGGMDRFAWTSFPAYTQGALPLDTNFALEHFSSLYALTEFISQPCSDAPLQAEFETRIPDDLARDLVMILASVARCEELKLLDKDTQTDVLKQLKEAGLRSRQLERITGLSKTFINRALAHI